jgi:hypothetical protein
LIVFLFRVVGAIRLRETLVRLRDRHAHVRQEHADQRTFEQLQLRFRQARDAAQWRQAICEAALHMDFAWVLLKTTYPDGHTDEELWRSAPPERNGPRLVTLVLPVSSSDVTVSQWFEVAVRVNGSLETANRRATLFGRLLDEHRIVLGNQA